MGPDEHNQYSPAGQIDQWGDLATGLRHNRSGTRRAGRVLLGVAVVVAAALVLIYALVTTGVLS